MKEYRNKDGSMEILGQSTKTITPQPYVHLGYLAASNRDVFAVPLIPGLLLLIFGSVQLYFRKKRHYIGSIVSIFFGLLFVGLSIAFYFDKPRISSVVISGANLKGLRTAMVVYAYENDGDLPNSETWCDLLIREMDVSPASFLTSGMGMEEGESIYALNENVINIKLSVISADVVLLFETNKGIEGQRTGSVLSRRFAKDFGYTEDHKIFSKRWNQVGGAKDITTEYHNGEGACVLFSDGSSEFVRIDDIPNLKWHPEESEMPLEN